MWNTNRPREHLWAGFFVLRVMCTKLVRLDGPLGAQFYLTLPGCAYRRAEVKLSLEGTTVFTPNRYVNHGTIV